MPGAAKLEADRVEGRDLEPAVPDVDDVPAGKVRSLCAGGECFDLTALEPEDRELVGRLLPPNAPPREQDRVFPGEPARPQMLLTRLRVGLGQRVRLAPRSRHDQESGHIVLREDDPTALAHDAPRGWSPASAIVSETSPVDRDSPQRAPPTKNATQLPSGEKNGSRAPSLPRTGASS